MQQGVTRREKKLTLRQSYRLSRPNLEWRECQLAGGWALVAGWFALGTMCLANYSSCDRYHCKITGPGFFGLGILTTLDTVGLVNPPAWVVFSALLALLGWVLVLNANFYKILKLVELGFSNWLTVSANLAIAYNNMNQIQKEQIRKSYMEKFGEFPNIEQFLQLGRKRNKF